MDYYEIINDGDQDVGGLLYASEDWPYPIARDNDDVANWQNLILELRDGEYCHFNDCVGGATVVSPEFKNMIESFSEEDFPIEFLPVRIKSTKYGDRIYYIMHFKCIFDVTDKENTVYAEGGTGIILRLRIDKDKVRNMHVFNKVDSINNVFISEKVRHAIVENNLNLGIAFLRV